MAIQTGTYPIIGHAGTLSVGGSSVDCDIASFNPTHEFDVQEHRDGAGEVMGLSAIDERITGTLTFRPSKATAITVSAPPVPFAAIVLAGFAAADTPGTAKGRSYINGKYIYDGGWSVRNVAGEILEITLRVWQGENFPTPQ